MYVCGGHSNNREGGNAKSHMNFFYAVLIYDFKAFGSKKVMFN